MCDTVFTLQTLLYRHFDQHIDNQKVSVFKCPDCCLLYAQKRLMMDHIKVCARLSSRLSGPQVHAWSEALAEMQMSIAHAAARERGGPWPIATCCLHVQLPLGCSLPRSLAPKDCRKEQVCMLWFKRIIKLSGLSVCT